MPSEFSSNIRQIARELKETDAKTATLVRRAIRVAVTEAAGGTFEAIKAKALAEKMPTAAGATKLRISFSTRSGGAKITTDGGKAPMARVLEKGSQGSGGAYDRHPVFTKKNSPAYKNPKRWVNQPTRPYFYGTAKAQERINEAALIAAVDAACKAAGWSGI